MPIRHLPAIVATALLAAAPAHAVDFLKEIDDVPLCAGLKETDEPAVFESDQGRVVLAYASGKADPAAVRDCYLKSLPALGWRYEKIGLPGDYVFLREYELLTITIAPPDARTPQLKVIFELTVRLASTKLPE